MKSHIPMSEQEIGWLEAWLAAPVFKGKAMRLDKLQGYLCAVVSSPDLIPPSRWIPEALGGEPEYDSLEQANEFMVLLMRFYNQVAAIFQEHQPLDLILKPHSHSDVRMDYQPWCEGYILGWALSGEEWLSPGNDPLKKLTFPILLLSGAFKENAESRGKEFMPPDEYAELEKECAGVLPNAVVGIYHFWRTARKAESTPRKSTKVGRNELCPCGSGKKFKQCCGKEQTLH